MEMTRPVPDGLKELLAKELTGDVGGAAHRLPHGSRQAGPTGAWHRRARWAGALAPAALVVVILPLGGLSSPRAIPTHASTPCTVYLRLLDGRSTSGGGALTARHPFERVWP
jgi:hypothetical protein